MIVIAQLSDIHFGSEADGTAAVLLDALNATAPDLVVLSGDLTMAARHEEFEKARAFIDAIDAPTLSVPGNHDITPYSLLERFFTPYRRWRRYVSRNIEPTWSDANVVVVGINTARRMRLMLDWSHGSVSHRQISGLSARFAAQPKTPFRIVVAHHPFLAEDTADLGTRPRVMVKRAREALTAFAKEKVDLVAAGHLHRTYATVYDGAVAPPDLVLDETPAPAPGPGPAALEATSPAEDSHKVTAVQAGTALSARTRGETNSFNRIAIEGDRLTVEVVRLGDNGWHRDPHPLVTLDKGAPAA